MIPQVSFRSLLDHVLSALTIAGFASNVRGYIFYLVRSLANGARHRATKLNVPVRIPLTFQQQIPLLRSERD